MLDAEKVERVRQWAQALLSRMEAERDLDVAIMACVDAAVRIIRATKGVDAAIACAELGKVVAEIGAAERST